MVQAASTQLLALGTPVPDFRLQDTNARSWQLSDLAGTPGLLVAFLCNHCPFVKHIQSGFADFARAYQGRGLSIVAISSNDVEAYPDDSPTKMRQEVERAGYVFPYLYDETQKVAKAYRAACTPDFFLFDADRKLVYRGQFDGSRPGNDVPVTGEDLRAAADAVLAGEAPAGEQRPSIGCNIKWKAGNEPEYFKH